MPDPKHFEMPTRSDNRSRLPIVERYVAKLSNVEQAAATGLAMEILTEAPQKGELSYFGPHALQGLGNTPFVFFGDPGEIPLFEHHSANLLEYRLSMLAGDGDLVVIGGDRNLSFEEYLDHDLGLGHRDYFHAEQTTVDTRVPAHVKCLKDEQTYTRLRKKIEELGGATLISHITTGTIWALAKKLGQDTGVLVHVAGPPPWLSANANSKIWFASVVKRLFGETAVPREYSAHSAAALAERVHFLARVCEKLVIKVPDSAGSRGNFPLQSSDIIDMSIKEMHLHLSELLTEKLGHVNYPLMVQIWDRDVLTSPSVQLWIPLTVDGPPVIEGIFEQSLTGENGKFAGAMPASLSEEWKAKLSHDALRLGHVFQELGYFGRCSFDTVLTGQDFQTADLHWIECNARWGGVSVPMTLMNRLFRNEGTPAYIEGTPAYIIVHRSNPDLRYMPFSTGLELLKDLLWFPGANNGIIFMTPSGFEDGKSLHFLSLATTTAAARQQADIVFQRLTVSQ